jgi:hypothetical protein
MTISATSQGLKPGVCTSSNRPANPYDGMMIYETDTNLVRIWNGSAWKTLAYSDYTSGTVLQTVHANTANDTNFSGTYTSTGIAATITPVSTSSKVLIFGSTNNISKGANRDWVAINIYKGGSSIFAIDDYVGDNSTSNMAMSMSGIGFTYLDSPATTSATTYTIYVKTVLGNTWTIGGGMITLQEIAG